MPIFRVHGLDDPRLQPYRLVRDPSPLTARRLFVAEGRLVVRRLLSASRFRTHSVLLTESAHEAMQDVLPRDTPIDVFVASLETLCLVTGFNMHRGCVALGERGEPIRLSELLSSSRAEPVPSPRSEPRSRPCSPIVVLEQVGNPDNIGGIFRSARALGARVVILSPGCADPLYRKSIRVSVAATLDVPFAVAEPWPSSLGVLRSAGFSLVGLTPDADATEVGVFSTDPARPQRVALLLGQEGAGLSVEALSWCSARIRIRMAPDCDSLNVATAAAIALHRLA